MRTAMRSAVDPAPAFELHVSERAAAAVRRLRRVLIGFALAGWLLAAPWFSGVAWGLWLAAGALLAAGAGWQARRAGPSNLSCGRLYIDEQGLASWRPVGGHVGLVAVQRWSAGERLVWLRLAGHRAAPRIDLLLVREAVGDEGWRRLRSWLLWLGRGTQ